MYNYIIWFLVISIYTPVFFSLYSFRWDKVDYTHAYFILPISIWLTWRKRRQMQELLQNRNNNYMFSGFFLLTTGLLMFIFGWREDYLFISTFSLIPVLCGLVLFIYGKKVLTALIFPIFYLLLLVPPPFAVLDSVTLPMRYATSSAAEIVLKFMDYPISRKGLQLTIGYYNIFMGQPCSGFRSLITMTSLMLVYIYISKGPFIKKLILTSLIVPLTLLGNLLRVVTLCLITFYFGEAAGQGFFHDFSGIVVFVIAILGIIGIEMLIDKVHSRKKACGAE